MASGLTRLSVVGPKIRCPVFSCFSCEQRIARPLLAATELPTPVRPFPCCPSIHQCSRWPVELHTSGSSILQALIVMRENAQPMGTGVVFERTLPVKFALSGPKWCAVVASGFVGAFTGNFFFKNMVMRRNPPNVRLGLRHRTRGLETCISRI